MLDYKILKPRKNTSPNSPLLVMLHGYGADMNDLFGFASMLPEELYILSLDAPLRLPWGGKAWYSIDFGAEPGFRSNNEEAESSMQAIQDSIHSFITENGLNPSKIFLLGFSQGAILSLAVLGRGALKPTGVMALSGYHHPPFVHEESQWKGADIFQSHGTQDQVIPVEWARSTAAMLKAAGAQSQFREYDMGHGINDECLDDIIHWLRERL
jgi:phospholipase/carboxylesterase